VLYLNLYDVTSNATLSNVAVDDVWWAANGAAATAFATSRGVGVWSMGELQADEPVDQTISNTVAWDSWVSAQYAGSTKWTTPAKSDRLTLAAVIAVPVVILGLITWFGRKKKR